MDYVLGDTKQAFITNKVTTTAQADNLLLGFKKMKVNGIRIPIFGRDVNGVDLNPNKPMMDYFYTQALAQGFDIFANPAQGGGGKRIANNRLNGNGATEGPDTSVNGVQAATDELIARMLEFSAEYPDCKWLNPFNEDGRATSSTWSVSQINAIYAALYNNVNGAELIGPCTWGLPAAIDMFDNTNTENYITIAASHNLGFNHSLWDDFIALADAKNLPVWDSEVNHNDAKGNGTRLEKAIENKVDGLVLYNSWNTVSLSDGSISTGQQGQMVLYLKDYTLPVNIALTGVATQSETESTTVFLDPSRAIDGNTNGSWNNGDPSISHTVGTNPWWQVDLGADKDIEEIKIYNRAENRETLANFTVSVINSSGNTTFSKVYSDYPNPILGIQTDNTNGQIVKVQLNQSGTLSMAEVQVFESSNSLSTKTIGEINFNIYPNPVQDVLNVNAPDAAFTNYTIYNINGQTVTTKKVNSKELQINMVNYPSGIYMIKLEGDGFSGSYRVIKK